MTLYIGIFWIVMAVVVAIAGVSDTIFWGALVIANVYLAAFFTTKRGGGHDPR